MQTTELTQVEPRWQVDYSHYLDVGTTYARLRAQENSGVPDKPGFNKHASQGMSQVQKDTLAIDAEVALALAFNLDPFAALVLFEPTGSKGKHQPDVYGLVEAKRVPTPDGALFVYGKDLTAGAPIVQVYVHYTYDEASSRLYRTGQAYLLGWQDPTNDKAHLNVEFIRPQPQGYKAAALPYYFTQQVRRPMSTFPSHIFEGVLSDAQL